MRKWRADRLLIPSLIVGVLKLIEYLLKKKEKGLALVALGLEHVFG